MGSGFLWGMSLGIVLAIGVDKAIHYWASLQIKGTKPSYWNATYISLSASTLQSRRNMLFFCIVPIFIYTFSLEIKEYMISGIRIENIDADKIAAMFVFAAIYEAVLFGFRANSDYCLWRDDQTRFFRNDDLRPNGFNVDKPLAINIFQSISKDNKAIPHKLKMQLERFFYAYYYAHFWNKFTFVFLEVLIPYLILIIALVSMIFPETRSFLPFR